MPGGADLHNLLVHGFLDRLSHPWGLAFDGANIWVSSELGGMVTKICANDGAVVGMYPMPSPYSYGVAFDGANIWVTNAGRNTIAKLRASEGANLGTFWVGTAPEGIVFDDANAPFRLMIISSNRSTTP